ncbi:MAG: sugar ABC transporter permease [Nakamurella sp.]
MSVDSTPKVAAPPPPVGRAGRGTGARGGRGMPTWVSGFLLVLPSIILIGVFIYYLIVRNFLTSLTNRNSNNLKLQVRNIGFDNYTRLIEDSNYQHAWYNLLVLTVAFIVGTMLFGIVWALLLEKGPKGEGLFRSVYLFPMAISFIASAVAWKWLLNPQTGDNAIGLNQLFQMAGLDGLQNAWFSSNSKFNMVAMAMPAIWQLSGYIMALFLAGFRGISDDQREAARMDGASEYKVYRYVLFPQLSPVALSALIIVGHMSMKMFDLIYALAGANSYVAGVPSTLLWSQLSTYKYGLAGANSTIILVVVAIFVVPYLVYTRRVEKKAGS